MNDKLTAIIAKLDPYVSPPPNQSAYDAPIGLRAIPTAYIKQAAKILRAISHWARRREIAVSPVCNTDDRPEVGSIVIALDRQETAVLREALLDAKLMTLNSRHRQEDHEAWRDYVARVDSMLSRVRAAAEEPAHSDEVLEDTINIIDQIEAETVSMEMPHFDAKLDAVRALPRPDSLQEDASECPGCDYPQFDCRCEVAAPLSEYEVAELREMLADENIQGAIVARVHDEVMLDMSQLSPQLRRAMGLPAVSFPTPDEERAVGKAPELGSGYFDHRLTGELPHVVREAWVDRRVEAVTECDHQWVSSLRPDKISGEWCNECGVPKPKALSSAPAPEQFIPGLFVNRYVDIQQFHSIWDLYSLRRQSEVGNLGGFMAYRRDRLAH